MDLLCKHHRKHNGEERTHEHNSEVELAQTFYYTAVSQTIYALINHLSKGTNKASYKLHRGKMTPNSSVFGHYGIIRFLRLKMLRLLVMLRLTEIGLHEIIVLLVGMGSNDCLWVYQIYYIWDVLTGCEA